jgi:hypothetical protein
MFRFGEITVGGMGRLWVVELLCGNVMRGVFPDLVLAGMGEACAFLGLSGWRGYGIRWKG